MAIFDKQVDQALTQDIHEGLVGLNQMAQELILMVKQLEELRNKP